MASDHLAIRSIKCAARCRQENSARPSLVGHEENQEGLLRAALPELRSPDRGKELCLWIRLRDQNVSRSSGRQVEDAFDGLQHGFLAQ